MNDGKSRRGGTGTGPVVILAVDRRTLGAPVKVVSGLRTVAAPEVGRAVRLSDHARRALRFATADEARVWIEARVTRPRPRWLLTAAGLDPDVTVTDVTVTRASELDIYGPGPHPQPPPGYLYIGSGLVPLGRRSHERRPGS